MEVRALVEHLEELRYRLLVIFIYFILFFGLGVMISPLIIKRIINDIIIANVNLVSLSPLEFIYTQIKVGFIFALALASPVIIYHLLRFLKPGLKRREILAIKYIMPSFLMLFIGGILFAYVVFLKISLLFLAKLSLLANIENMWSISKFISFILAMSLSFGVIFQLPLIFLLLNTLNILNSELLRKYRSYIYIIIFIIAALITPPDIVTMVILALPLIVLFEFSYWLVKIID